MAAGEEAAQGQCPSAPSRLELEPPTLVPPTLEIPSSALSDVGRGLPGRGLPGGRPGEWLELRRPGEVLFGGPVSPPLGTCSGREARLLSLAPASSRPNFSWVFLPSLPCPCFLCPLPSF